MQKRVFLGFCEELVDRLVDRMAIRLDAVASIPEKGGIGRPIGRIRLSVGCNTC